MVAQERRGGDCPRLLILILDPPRQKNEESPEDGNDTIQIMRFMIDSYFKHVVPSFVDPPPPQPKDERTEAL